jgi:hypothetical protein
MGSGASINKKEIELTELIGFNPNYLNDNTKDYETYIIRKKDYEYYIIRQKDDVILYLGKIIKCEPQYEFEHMMGWHDGPIYKLLYNEIVFEKSDTIDDKILIETFKNLDENSIKYLIENYSNLFIV